MRDKFQVSRKRCGFTNNVRWWLRTISLLVLLPFASTMPMPTAFAAPNEEHIGYLPIIFNGNGVDPTLFQIALIDEEGAWLITSRGSRKLLLTKDVQLSEVADELSLYVSPDAQHVAVQRSDGWAIYASSSRLVTDNIAPDFALTWEPAATSLLLSRLGHGMDRFFLSDRRTIPLLETSDETNDHSPLWSADQSSLVFAHHEFGTHLYVTVIPEFDETEIPYVGENRDSGQFNAEFMVMNEIDSWHDQPIRFHWANDGQRLIFAAGSTIHVYNPATKEHSTITPAGFGERESGRAIDLYNDRILYFAGDGIYEVGLDGLNPRHVVAGDDLHYPQWGPNGERVVYRGTDDQLYIVNADGTNNHAIPNTTTVIQFDLLDYSSPRNSRR